MRKKMIQTIVSFPEGFLKGVDAVCEKLALSRSAFIRLAIQHYVKTLSPDLVALFNNAVEQEREEKEEEGEKNEQQPAM